MAKGRTNQNPGASDYEIFTPQPERPNGFRQALFFLTNLLERLSFLSKKSVYIIAATLLIFVFLLTFIKNFYKPEYPSPALPGVTLSPVSVESTNIIVRDDKTAVGVVYLRNPNRAFGISALRYSWQALSDSGEVEDYGAGQTFILPEQDKYLVLPLQKNSSRRLLFNLESHDQSFRRLVFSIPEFEATNVKGEITSNGYEIQGEVVNRSAYILRLLELVALLRAPNGVLRGAISTELNDVSPGQVVSFHLSWPKALPGDTIIDVRAATNGLSELNLGLPN